MQYSFSCIISILDFLSMLIDLEISKYFNILSKFKKDYMNSFLFILSIHNLPLLAPSGPLSTVHSSMLP